MTRRILVAITALLVLDTASATRVLEQVENSVELTLGGLNLPTISGETVSFSACVTCGVSTHRLMDTTVYTVNGNAVPFAEFLRIATEIKQRSTGADNTFAGVFLDRASGRVTRIELRELTRR